MQGKNAFLSKLFLSRVVEGGEGGGGR